MPVAVTFCPLCNTAITFDRTIAGTVYDFGVSGLLRNSDLIMYDSQTESLWQQIGGAAIVGDMVGARLTVLPSTIVAWGDFKAQYPEGIVLSRETGYARRYGANPYAGYDRIGNTPFLFRGEIDPRLSAMERVVTLDLPGDAVAYPFALLAERRAVADVRDGRPIVVFWTPGVTSALDAADIARSRDVGATGVFERTVDGRPLDFRPNPDDPATFLDEQTQSVWNIFGSARSGPLAGSAADARRPRQPLLVRLGGLPARHGRLWRLTESELGQRRRGRPSSALREEDLRPAVVRVRQDARLDVVAATQVVPASAPIPARPPAMIRPSASISRRSHQRAARFTSWITTSTPSPRACVRRSSAWKNSDCCARSRLCVGSSSSSTAGSWASAIASATRCCSPPDSWR